jgi:hypothetical protein
LKEGASRAREAIHLAQDVGNPKPWMKPNVSNHAGTSRPSPNQQVIGADVDDAERDGGSMMRAGSDEAGARQVMLCATVNGVTNGKLGRAAERSPTRKQVIGADQNAAMPAAGTSAR